MVGFIEVMQMKILYAVSFIAFVFGLGGTENQNEEFQALAIGIMFLSLITLFITNKIASMSGKKKNAPACGNRTRSNRDNQFKCIIARKGMEWKRK